MKVPTVGYYVFFIVGLFFAAFALSCTTAVSFDLVQPDWYIDLCRVVGTLAAFYALIMGILMIMLWLRRKKTLENNETQ